MLLLGLWHPQHHSSGSRSPYRVPRGQRDVQRPNGTSLAPALRKSCSWSGTWRQSDLQHCNFGWFIHTLEISFSRGLVHSIDNLSLTRCGGDHHQDWPRLRFFFPRVTVASFLCPRMACCALACWGLYFMAFANDSSAIAFIWVAALSTARIWCKAWSRVSFSWRSSLCRTVVSRMPVTRRSLSSCSGVKESQITVRCYLSQVCHILIHFLCRSLVTSKKSKTLVCHVLAGNTVVLELFQYQCYFLWVGWIRPGKCSKYLVCFFADHR